MRRPSISILLLSLISTSAWADFGDPLPGLTASQLAQFQAGRAQFITAEDVADGLGPVYNDVSCGACHSSGSAVGGNTTRVEFRFGTLTGGVFDPLAGLGGSLLQDHAIGSEGVVTGPDCVAGFSYVAEAVPAQATIVAGRRTTPLFGLGLVEAVSDDTLRMLAQSEPAAVAGIVNLITDADSGQTVVGRFGWKDQHGRLHAFAGDAYLNEMGITNPSFPNEICPQGNCAALACNPKPALNDDGGDVQRFTQFMQLLAAPPRGPINGDVTAGEQAFRRIGCADCHTPTLVTGPSPVAALANQTIHPYSDFLLHDMGSLGDGITQGAATGRLLRTTPLWGVRIQQTLIHDGRATTLRDAILAHDGQAAASRAAFVALPAVQQQKLLAFLGSL